MHAIRVGTAEPSFPQRTIRRSPRPCKVPSSLAGAFFI